MGAIPHGTGDVLEDQDGASDHDSRAVIERTRRLFEANKDEALANDRKTVILIREYLEKRSETH
jgi:hypothetical protein